MQTIHIIAPFLNANGGDWRAIDMYLSLRKSADVHLWSQNAVHSDLINYPIQEIKPYQGTYPSGGMLYICGTSTAIGRWYDLARFDRIVLIHNLYDQDIFYRAMNRLVLNGTKHVEVAYASKMIQDSIGLPGEVLYPIPDPDRFKPAPRGNIKNRAFTVGRISTDKISKHHYMDIPLYKQLAAEGIKIKIVGGTCLKPWLDGHENIQLLPTIPHSDVPAMLNTFDCFFYRVSSHLKEAFGIVVAEAHIAGLPVVCYNEGGYTEYIESKENGFLFETNEEAVNVIIKLESSKNSHHSSNRFEY